MNMTSKTHRLIKNQEARMRVEQQKREARSQPLDQMSESRKLLREAFGKSAAIKAKVLLEA